eukprot:CAMPEP_0197181514 /NCGR_PEP_ID=MMETSP1423-20130617/5775_1 /TAXON_ID=476441 /ORGANISM="Pseudo-nitzschia heimii, Strain UNC1101" /LENGTH=256 /DNA_ID=CAMNT_0042631775 /DNA_START=216 /DNA_END=986 /DNA_ORIENTATION=-
MTRYSISIGTVLVLLLFVDLNTKNALAFAPPNKSSAGRTSKNSFVLRAARSVGENDRRIFLRSLLTTTAVIVTGGMPLPAAADPKKRYILDDETGEYVEAIEDGDWKKEWKSRYDQMSTMSRDEIFTAARGAGNVDSKDLINESPASKKRRAFSGCRDKGIRSKLGNIDEKSCTKRVLEGDVQFVLEVTDSGLSIDATASTMARAVPSPVVDAVPPATAVVPSSTDIDADLLAAKQRIAEIEERLSKVKRLSEVDR